VEPAGGIGKCFGAGYAHVTARIGANGQADERRVSIIRIYSTGQHYDARAADRCDAAIISGFPINERAGYAQTASDSGEAAGGNQVGA
jgi:hypothetical protein